jgi:hypothetical protein
MTTRRVIMPTTTGPRPTADRGRSKTNTDPGALVMSEMKGIAIAGGTGAVGKYVVSCGDPGWTWCCVHHSRSAGVDVQTGVGLSDALHQRVEVIVHSTKELRATRISRSLDLPKPVVESFSSIHPSRLRMANDFGRLPGHGQP